MLTGIADDSVRMEVLLPSLGDLDDLWTRADNHMPTTDLQNGPIRRTRGRGRFDVANTPDAACPRKFVASFDIVQEMTPCKYLLTIFFRQWKNRLVAAFGPRMTTEDSGESHPTSSQHATALNGFIGVLRACRIEAAEPLGNDKTQKAVIQRKCSLIQSDECEHDSLKHGMKIPRLRRFVNGKRADILV